MFRVLLFVAAAAAAFGADDPWAKVRELKSGAELRIVKKGAAQPVLAKFDEVTDENVLVVLKNAQVAIPKDQIERIDYRPAKPGRVKADTKTTPPEPPTGVDRTTVPITNRPSRSMTSGVTIESKPDFETVYRRQPVPAKK
jgi:hypothetical protein